MTVIAVIPVKQLENAKQRLAGILSAEERKNLFTAMVSDVLTAVAQCPEIDGVMIITADPSVEKLAGEFQAEVMGEPEEPGLIPAVTAAAVALAKQAVNTMVFVPGDVPLITAEELSVILADQEGDAAPHMTIAPASDLGGSNCVACCPPDCMPFGFGVDSFRRHLRLARKAAVSTRVTKLPGVGLDIDTPDDLRELSKRLAQNEHQSHTRTLLAQLDLGDRLDTMDETG